MVHIAIWLTISRGGVVEPHCQVMLQLMAHGRTEWSYTHNYLVLRPNYLVPQTNIQVLTYLVLPGHIWSALAIATELTQNRHIVQQWSRKMFDIGGGGGGGGFR